jgi:hypothetical protein
MLNFFLSVYEIKDVKKFFFKFNLILNIFQTFFILPFFFIRNNFFFTGIIVFIFILLTTYLNLNSKFYERPLSFILMFITTLFVNIPLIFITYCGIDYNYEYFSKKIPFSRDVYTMLFPYSVIWLFFSWLAIYLGISLSGIKKLYLYQKKATIRSDENKQERYNVWLYEKFKEIKLSTIVFWVILVFFFSILKDSEYQKIYLGINFENIKIYNYISLIFMEEIIFFLFLIVNFNLSNCKGCRLNTKKSYLTFFILVLLLLISKIHAGSRGSLVLLLSYLFLNLIILSQFHKTKMIFFSRTFLMFIPILTILLFSFGDFTRIYYRGIETSNVDIFFNLEGLSNMLTNILYRISAAGTHQFILIFVSYINSIIDLNTSISLLKYIAYNLTNLFSPGTIFLDYYSPTSQFLEDIINHGMIYNIDITHFQLVKTFNTQAFSIWGFFLIVFNFFSFFFLFFFSFLMALMFKTKNLFVKILILKLFYGFFFNYAPEYVLFNNIALTINCIIVFNILIFLSKVFSKSTSYK